MYNILGRAVPVLVATLLMVRPAAAQDGFQLETLADESGRQFLQLEAPPLLDGKPLDTLELELPKPLAKTVQAGQLPPSWNLDVDGATAVLQGPPAPDLTEPLRFRLDFFGARPPKDLRLSALSRGQRVLRQKVAVVVQPVLKVLGSLDGVLALPPVLSPGETLTAEVLSDALPPGGQWNIAGAAAGELPGATRVVQTRIPQNLSPTDPVSVSYQDPFGHTRVDVPEVPDCRFGPPTTGPPERPRITGGTTHAFLGGTICLCGSFPEECRDGLSLGDIPLGPPITATDGYLMFRVPEAAYPAEHEMTGSPSVGFSRDDRTSITLLQVLGSIDQDRLLRGESTQLRLAVVGTHEVLTLELENLTPGIVSLAGGELQLVEVTGSGPGGPGGQAPPPDWSEVLVNAVSPGDFDIRYTLTIPPCPCVPPTGPATTTTTTTPTDETYTDIVLVTPTGEDIVVTGCGTPVPIESFGVGSDGARVPVQTELSVSPESLGSITGGTFVPTKTPGEGTIVARLGDLVEEIPVVVQPECPEGQQCSPITHIVDAGPPIQINLRAPDPIAAFPYPRPVPLQAQIRDYDTATFYCSGCGGGTSELSKPFEDAIAKITWTLHGPGSLNTPFSDTVDLEQLKREIEELRERIRELAAKIEELKARKAALDASRDERRAALEAELAELRRRLAEQREERTRIQTRIEQIQSEIAELEGQIAEAEAAAAEIEAEIEAKREEVKRLEELISNKPSPEEVALAEQLAELQRRIEDKKSELIEMREQHAQEEQQLLQALNDAEAALVAARTLVNQFRAQIQAIQDEIQALENDLFTSSLIRDLLLRRARISRLAQQIRNTYLPSSNLPISPANRLGELMERFGLERNADGRRSLLDQIRGEGDRLVSDLGSGCAGLSPGPDRDACSSMVDDLERELDELSDQLSESIDQPSSTIDPEKWERLQELRDQLASLEGQISAAEQSLRQAEEAAAQALEAYVNGLARFEQEESALVEEIRRLEEEAAELQAALNDAIARREREYAENLSSWQEQVASLRQQIAELERRLAEKQAEIEAHNREIDAKREEVTAARLELQAVEMRITQLERKIAKTEQQLADLDTESDRLQQEIDDKEKEKERLEKELEELERRLASLTAGNTTASGPLVYYIPPPLEEILEDPGKFDELKKKIAEREAELEEARGKKASLQKRAFRILKQMATKLAALHDVLAQIDRLKEEIRDLNAEKATMENEITAANLQQLREAQERKAELEQQKREAEEANERAEDDERRLSDEVDQEKAKLDQATQAVEAAREEAERQRAGHASDRERRLRLAETLEQRKAEHERLVNNVRDVEAELASAEDRLARAAATGDEQAAARARTERNQVKARLNGLQEAFEASRRELDDMALRLNQAVVAERTSAQSVVDAERDLRDAENNRIEQRQKLLEKTTELEAARERKLATERELGRLEQEIERTEKRIEELHAATNQKIEDNDQVKDKAAEIEKKEQELEEAEQRKGDIEFDLNKLIEERNEWKEDKEEVDDEIAEAEQKLENARQELRDFLKNEFETVKIEVEIRIAADDKPLDDPWRSDDDETLQPFQIKYPNRRIPQVDVASVAGPSEKRQDAVCLPRLNFEKAGPITKEEIVPGSPKIEPQTIALFYRKGEPLYEQWPPVEENDDYLMRSAAPWGSGGTDEDTMSRHCEPGGGGSGISVGAAVGEGEAPTVIDCAPSQGPIEPLKDLVHYGWTGGEYFSETEEQSVYLKVPDLPPDKCTNTSELEVSYLDSGLQAADDPDNQKKKYPHVPGLLAEVPELVSDFDSDGKTEIPSRLFEGAHIGLPAEEIYWDVKPEAPDDLDPELYGYDADRAKRYDEETDGDGYSKVDFYLTERYGKLEATVTWKRDGQVCRAEEFDIQRLLELELLEIGFATREGWEQAEKLFKGESSDVEALAKEIEAEEITSTVVIGTGLRDDLDDPFDSQKILFDALAPAGISVDPEEMETRIAGLAWSFVEELPEDADVELEGKVEQKLEEVTEPAEVSGKQSTKTAKRFRIGTDEEALLLEAADEFVPGGDPYTGKCTLIVDDTGLPVEFATLELNADGIRTESGGSDEDPPLALDGKVVWTGSKKFSHWGFELTVTEIGLEASVDGRIAGKLKLPKTQDEPSFTAVFGADGFIGEFADFPEVKLVSFTLEKGAAVAIDLHSSKEPEPTPAKWDGTGLLIRHATLVLPDAFSSSSSGPAKVSAKELIINTAGVTGEVKLSYQISAGMGKLDFTIDALTVNLNNSEPTGGTIEGGVKLPDPFVGSVKVTVTIASGGTSFTFKVHTDHPVAVPRLGLVFSLLPDTQLSYVNEIFTFQLSAVITAESFDEITIKGFMVNSEGDVKADEIAINRDLSFGRGFQIHLETFGFSKIGSDFGLSLACKFQFAEILEAEKVSISISPGPKIESFEFKVNARRDPVTFETTIKYSENLLQGEVLVDVEKLFEIRGMFVLGVQEETPDTSFRYWYVELAVRTAIPLGNTGLNIIELGGGLGYNYDPPIGHAAGASRRTDSFSFKASMAIGNAPRGEVFAGRVTLVLVSGKFSINGKVWVLDSEDSLYGEGQLDIYWEPSSKLAGFVRMVIALPDSDGTILRFNGQVDFLFAGSDNWYVKSRTIEGAVLERIKGEGTIDIKPGSALLAGRLYYDFYGELDVAIVTVKVQVNLEAAVELQIQVTQSGTSLNASARFSGYWDVNLDTAVGEFDIISGSVAARLALAANSSRISVEGSVTVSWDTWIHSGSVDVELGFEMAA
jgi:chromosome segregation ATPase